MNRDDCRLLEEGKYTQGLSNHDWELTCPSVWRLFLVLGIGSDLGSETWERKRKKKRRRKKRKEKRKGGKRKRRKRRSLD